MLGFIIPKGMMKKLEEKEKELGRRIRTTRSRRLKMDLNGQGSSIGFDIEYDRRSSSGTVSSGTVSSLSRLQLSLCLSVGVLCECVECARSPGNRHLL